MSRGETCRAGSEHGDAGSGWGAAIATHPSLTARGPPTRPAERRAQTTSIAGASPAPTSTSTASVSFAIQSVCSSRSPSPAGSVRLIAVGQLEPGVLAHRVDAVDELVDPALERQLVVDRGLERHRDPVGPGNRPALLAGPLDEHLVRAELVPGRPEPAAAEILEVSRLERGPHRAELLAELRPEHGKVRLDAQLGVDVPELDLLHPQLLRDLVGVGGGERRAFDDDPAQRLAQLQSGRRARLVAERDDGSQLRDLGEQARVGRARLGPAGEEDRGRSVLGDVGDERLPEVLGEERHHRRDHAEPLDEPEPERAQCRLVAVPEAAPGAADVPVREIVDVRVEGARDVDREPALVAALRLLDELGRPLDEPAVERLQVGSRARRCRDRRRWAGTTRSRRSRRGTWPSSRASAAAA